VQNAAEASLSAAARTQSRASLHAAAIGTCLPLERGTASEPLSPSLADGNARFEVVIYRTRGDLEDHGGLCARALARVLDTAGSGIDTGSVLRSKLAMLNGVEPSSESSRACALPDQPRHLLRAEPCLQDVPVARDQLTPAVEQLFSPGFLRRVLAAAPDAYRKRLLTIEVVAISMLNVVLLQSRSFLQLVDKLRMGKLPGLQAVEVSRSAFYKRLRALPHTLFLTLLRETTRSLTRLRTHQRGWVHDLAPFANGIYAIDDTTLDALARRSRLLKELPKGAMETLGGRLGCALDLATGAFAELCYDFDSEANEKNHIRPLVERLGAGNMLVFDLGYFSFPFFDYLTEHFCYFVSRLRNKTSYSVIETLAEGRFYRDRVIYLGKHRADRAAHPVRLVELLIDRTWYAYITNMLDPGLLNAQQIWALYAQRWTIEKSFAAVKRALGMAFLHASHRNGMLIQIWCTLAVYQVLQDLRLQIAGANNWREDEVSWLNLMQRISLHVESPPSAGPDLRTWLIDNAESLYLKKRGVRKRRRDGLPKVVLNECKKTPPPPDFSRLKSRTPHQSKPEPLKDPRELIVGRLS
jgi:hypothetical protein